MIILTCCTIISFLAMVITLLIWGTHAEFPFAIVEASAYAYVGCIFAAAVLRILTNLF